MTQERANQLGSAHEVQRFHRDVDETVDWIQEKDEALNNDDCGTSRPAVGRVDRVDVLSSSGQLLSGGSLLFPLPLPLLSSVNSITLLKLMPTTAGTMYL